MNREFCPTVFKPVEAFIRGGGLCVHILCPFRAPSYGSTATVPKLTIWPHPQACATHVTPAVSIGPITQCCLNWTHFGSETSDRHFGYRKKNRHRHIYLPQNRPKFLSRHHSWIWRLLLDGERKWEGEGEKESQRKGMRGLVSKRVGIVGWLVPNVYMAYVSKVTNLDRLQRYYMRCSVSFLMDRPIFVTSLPASA